MGRSTEMRPDPAGKGGYRVEGPELTGTAWSSPPDPIWVSVGPAHSLSPLAMGPTIAKPVAI